MLAAVEERGLLSRMLFSCFEDPVLASPAGSELAGAPRRAGLGPKARPGARAGARVAAEAVNPHVSLVDRTFVEAAHAAGLAVYPYTANEEREMSRLLDCGVDGVITNYPDRLRRLVDRR